MKKKKNVKPFRPFILDVEASGFGCESYPIEIGLALEKENRYCSLIIPSDRQAFTISPLECILTEPQMEIWHTTKESIFSTMALTRHRACSDALIIQETFFRSRMKTQNQTMNLQPLLQIKNKTNDFTPRQHSR